MEGIGLVVSRCYEPHERLHLTLHNPSKGISRSVVVRVVYCVAHPANEWILGAQFIRSLSAAELQSLLS